MSSGFSSVPILLLFTELLAPLLAPLPLPVFFLASLIVLPAFGGSKRPLHAKQVTLKVVSVAGSDETWAAVGGRYSSVVRHCGYGHDTVRYDSFGREGSTSPDVEPAEEVDAVAAPPFIFRNGEC